MIPLVIAAVIALFVLLFIFIPIAAWIIIGIIVLALIVVLLVPFGADISYVNNEFKLSARIDGMSLQLIPKKSSGEAKPKKEKKPKQEKSNNTEGEKKEKSKLKLGFNKDELLELLKRVIKGAAKFGKLTVNRFMLHYTAGGNDPYKTAVTFNYVNAALSVLAPICISSFRLRCKPDVWTDIDFMSEKMKIDGEVSVTVKLIQVVHMGLSIGCGVLAVLLKSKRRQKKEKQNNNIEANKQNETQSEERTDSNG